MKKDIEYAIIIEDSIEYLKEYLEEHNGRNLKYLILTDNNIPLTYIDEVNKLLSSINDNIFVYVIDAGEDSKSLENVKEISEFMLANSFTKQDYIINLGGGVVCDLGAFVASIYKRGCKYINVPTSLLADVDAAIGSKCAVNLADVKNVLGTFYDPSLVLINTTYLESLDFRNKRNGLFEALKIALIRNDNLYDYFKNIDINDINYKYIIEECVNIKTDIVSKDYYDEGLRHVLNFGHTIGHVIEKTDINYLHGEAVAIGMLYFIKNNELRTEVLDIYKRLDFNVNNDFDFKKYINILHNDKKCFYENESYYINAVIVENVGDAKITKMKI